MLHSFQAQKCIVAFSPLTSELIAY